MCNPQHLEDRQEVAGMIRALTKALIQPLETPAPKPEPNRLQLLLVMEDKRQEEVKVEDKRQEDVKVEDPREEVEQEEKEELLIKSPTALRRVFEGDSDQETFHGFQDEDMDN